VRTPGGIATLAFAITVGLAAGVGAYTFLYAKGYSYMTNDPAACANCHVMNTQFDAWAKGPHHAVATCNDCHAPHEAPLAKLFVKGRNGFNHSLMFTTGKFPEPIRITPHNRRVTEAACRYCHEEIVAGIDHAGSRERLSCIRCHHDVGHSS
jgi:cytochrome c nitrite reductase small subunit